MGQQSGRKQNENKRSQSNLFKKELVAAAAGREQARQTADGAN
jgi:hypothetical protein